MNPSVSSRPHRRTLLISAAAVLLALVAAVVSPNSADPARAVDEGGGYNYSIEGDGVLYSSSWGTYKVYAPFFDGKHRSFGGGSGALGYPIGNQIQQSPRHWYQQFERGVIYAGPYGTYAVLGEQWDGYDYGFGTIAGEHGEQGGGTGLGYPLSDRVGQGGSYQYQRFEAGNVYLYYEYEYGIGWTAATVKGGFLPKHNSFGGGTGVFGYPTDGEYLYQGEWTQFFQGGFMEFDRGYWSCFLYERGTVRC